MVAKKRKKEVEKQTPSISKIDLLKIVKEVMPLVPDIMKGLREAKASQGAVEDSGRNRDGSRISLLHRIEQMRVKVSYIEDELASIASELKE